MTSSIRTAFAALTLAAAVVATAQQISVEVDGKTVAFQDTAPRMVNGRVLVPLRGVFEEMGAYVNWNPSTRMVTATRGGADVQLRIGDRNAVVNGAPLTLDVPAMIMGSSTMVPIRFVSEALGADVGWFAAMNRVRINTTSAGNTGSTTVTNPPRTLRRVMVEENTVIPVRLDHTLSTLDAKKGEKFTATVVADGDSYGTIPRGTKVEGRVVTARRRTSNQPALLELAFDRLRFPNGRSVKIDGTLTSMDDEFVTRDGNGVMTAREGGKGDQRMVYAGYGAGAGLLVGLLTKRPLEGAVLGGALGYLLGQVQKDQRQQTTEITLNPGTEMGVRVNRDVAVSWADDGR